MSKGVGGWLLFLCAYLILLRPMLFLLGTYLLQWTYYGSFRLGRIWDVNGPLVFVDLALYMWGVIAGVNLLMIRKNADAQAKVFFYAVSGTAVLFAAVNQNVLPLTSAVVGALWVWYLSKSNRVRATFRGLLPRNVFCPKCNSPLTLTMEETQSREFSCGQCGGDFAIDGEQPDHDEDRGHPPCGQCGGEFAIDGEV